MQVFFDITIILSVNVNLGGMYTIDAIKFTQRADNYNGRIKEYKILVSGDGSEYTEVAAGEFPNDYAEREISLNHINCRYIRIVPLSSYDDLNYLNMAEFNVYGITAE